MNSLPPAPGYCPKCGFIGGMVYIPKHRNGVQGRYCNKCGDINFKDHEGNPIYDHGPSSSKGFVNEWKRPSGNLRDSDFRGIVN